jgi:hypothetical protein
MFEYKGVNVKLYSSASYEGGILENLSDFYKKG